MSSQSSHLSQFLVRERDVEAAVPKVEDSFIRQYLHYGFARSEAPLGYQLIGAYNLVSAVAPRDLELHQVAGGPYICNMYGLIVGRSGIDRKSTCISMNRKMLGAAAPDLVGSDPGSAEGLDEALCDQPSQLWYISEMGNFLAGARSNQSYQHKIKTKITERYDGSPIHTTFAKGRVLDCPDPRLSIFAAINPAYLMVHTERADWEGGMFSRFTCSFAETEREVYVNKATHEQWVWLVGRLAQMAQTPNAVPCAGLSDEAWQMYVGWNQAFRKRTKPLADRFSGQIARTASFILKFAQLVAFDVGHARDSLNSSYVLTPFHLEPAIAMAELHWRSVQGIAHSVAATRDIRDARLIREILGQAGEGQWVSERRLYQQARPIGLKRRVQEIVETMAISGEVLGTTIGQKFWRLRTPAELEGDRLKEAADLAQTPVSVDSVISNSQTEATPEQTQSRENIVEFRQPQPE